MAGEIEVYLEVGTKRVFACAVDWPGWCRSGKNEENALAALADYAERYRVVTKQAGVRFPAAAAPATLPKGPRGGGRDTAAIVQHVAEAELAYARSVGVRSRQADAAFRSELVRVLRSATGRWDRDAFRWPPRYAARRIAWHVLDHVWEIEDKAAVAGPQHRLNRSATTPG